MTRPVALLALLAAALPARAADLPAPLNTKAPDFALPDVTTGKPWATADLPKDTKAVVLAFVCTGCPVSTAYLPKLADVHKQGKDDGVTVVAVNCHPADTAADAAAQAKELKLPFPVLKDADGKLAERLNVDRVPTVLVLDAGRMVRYFGRVDDQYAPGVHGARATTKELTQAVRAVTENRDVPTPYTKPAGCALGKPETKVVPPARSAGAEGAGGVESAVTYHRDVARVIQARCQECHRPGEAAPFALGSYKQAKAWSGMIREVVADGVMPPWHADAPRGHFKNDRRLSEPEKSTLLKWVDAGCPEGDPADGPPAKTYPQGWRLGRDPDLVVKMTKSVNVPAQYMLGAIGMPYQYSKGDTKFAEDTWVTGVEVRPDLRAAIHHIIVYTVPPGARLQELAQDDGFSRHMLAAFVPGDDPTIYPAGMAKKIPAGATLIFEVHYTPNGKAGVDRSSVGLLTSKTAPTHEVKTDAGQNHRLSIPPGVASHEVRAPGVVFDKPATIISMSPHMHVRGKAFRYELVKPDGTKEVVLNVPKYDFNWQVGYAPAKPIKVEAGSRLVCTAWYDNSTGNPANPDPTKRVRWGSQTWEEMMLGFVEFYE